MSKLEEENKRLTQSLKEKDIDNKKLIESNEEMKKQNETQSGLVQILYREQAQLVKQLEKWKIQIDGAATNESEDSSSNSSNNKIEV